jgi:hypothetical protein
MQSVIWKDEAKIKILVEDAGAALDKEDALLRVNKAILDRFYRALPDLWTIPAGYEIGRFLTRDQFNEFLRSSADGLSNPDHAAHWIATQLALNPEAKANVLARTQARGDVPTCASKCKCALFQVTEIGRAPPKRPACKTHCISECSIQRSDTCRIRRETRRSVLVLLSEKAEAC